jgi:hypothetical protein
MRMMNAREYVGPVRPKRDARWDAWCRNDHEAGRSAEWRAGFNYAMQTMALWLDFQVSRVPPGDTSSLNLAFQLSSIGMLKSNLLGRLMKGDEIRRVPCPVHQGRLQLAASAYGKDVSCCDGFGWLRNEGERSGAERGALQEEHWLTHPQREAWWREGTGERPGA